MTSTKDVHDMLGLTAEQVSQPKPKKKGKPTFKKPDGMAREVFSLLGERAPPIPLTEPSQYKAKRRLGPSETAQWRETPFTIPSRNDGLVLRHWIKQLEKNTLHQPDATISMDSSTQAADGEEGTIPLPANVQVSRDRNLYRIKKSVKDRQIKTEPVHDEYKFSKYDIHAPKPSYDDAVYNEHLKSDEWSREETDHLMNLYSEYYGKWPIIVDRWDYEQLHDYHQSDNKDTDGSASASSPSSSSIRPRSMEELKSRFYRVSAKLMELRTPVSQMSATEFNNHEKMTKFDPKQEIERKRYKDTVLSRSRSERDEERLLLAELERMYKRQEQFEAEIRDLRQRLDHSLTDDIPNAQHYTSSQEITGLFQKMIQRDKNNKLRRSVNDPTAASSSPTAANIQNPPATTNATVAANQSGNKRSSLANQSTAPGRRALSPGSEARFGITTHDRLTFGVSFKSDRIAKARLAKSQSKTEKIATLLNELGVPDLIQLPTTAVCSSMEDLVKKINILIDQRKIMEKQENDLKVAKELKAQKEGKSAEDTAKGGQEQQLQQDQESNQSHPTNQEQSEEQQGQGQEDTSAKKNDSAPKAVVDDSTVDDSTVNVDTDGDVEVKDAPSVNGEDEDEAEAEVEDVEQNEVEEDEDEEEEEEEEEEDEEEEEEEEEEEDEEEEAEEEEDDDNEDVEAEAEVEADADVDVDGDVEEDEDVDSAGEEAPSKEADVDTETSRPSTRGNAAAIRNSKRSASVFSEASTGSAKSRTSKRLKASRA